MKPDISLATKSGHFYLLTTRAELEVEQFRNTHRLFERGDRWLFLEEKNHLSACFRSTPIPKLLYRPVLWGRALASSRSQWRDSLCIGTGASRRPALFPKLFPIPDPMRHLARQWRSEL